MAASLVLTAVSARAALRVSYRRRQAARARFVAISPPAQVDPDGGTVLWRNLLGLLRPSWRRWLTGQPHLSVELHATAAGITLGIWVPGDIPPGLVEHAITAAWPGAHTQTSPATAPLPHTATAHGGRLHVGAPEWFPLATGHQNDPLRPLFTVASHLPAGDVACVLARFLRLVGRAGQRPAHGWSWEPLDGVPFTPRIRHRRTILVSACWLLPPVLTRAARDTTTWQAVLDRWRTETTPTPPTVVVVDDGDRHLPLDLDRGDDRELLRRYLTRGGIHAVLEPPGGPDAVQAVLPSPTGAHLLEVVVPLARRHHPPAPRPTQVAVRTPGTGMHLPGGPWLSLAIRTPHAELVLPELARLAHDLARHYDRWFWLRYHTRALGPHLRARFHGDPATLGSRILPTVAEWCQELAAQRLTGGFTVEPYDQEIERYGGPGATDAAERVFAADSTLVLALLAATTDTDQRLVLAALSAAHIATCLTGSDLAALAGRRLDRASRHRMHHLRPAVRAARSCLADGPDLDGISPLWTVRRDALAAYRDALDPIRRADCASSLIHMHLNRLLTHQRDEPLVRALAADLLTGRP